MNEIGKPALRRLLTGWFGAAALLMLSAFWSVAVAEDFVPITDEILLNPADEDWPMWRRTYNHWGFSPLDQINTENVEQLTLAWARAVEPGIMEGTPLVYNGIMYFAGPGDVIVALDATTGDLIWEYRRDLPPEEDLPGVSAIVRNISLYEDKIFHAARDAHIIALDARDGSLVWETAVGDYREAHIGHSSGPLVANGVVVSGRNCGAQGPPESCFIAGHDVETGEELWRTHTIPQPGEYGFDSWGDLPYESRRHVGSWGQGSYDPELDLFYWGTSVPAPSAEIVRGTPGADILYANSTLALDRETGEIVWYYQHLPRENWDLDHPFERYLIDTQTAPSPDEVRWINPEVEEGREYRVVTGMPGKTGIMYTLDRETGEFLWARETIYQNLVADIEVDTGQVIVSEDAIFEEVGQTLNICPPAWGGKNFWAGVYNPNTGALSMPMMNTCMDATPYTEDPGWDEGYALEWEITRTPDNNENIGSIYTISVETGETLWQYDQPAAVLSMVGTGGGLLFGGDVNKRFRAYHEETGEILWETILGSRVTGYPVTYAVDGKQYVAVAVGGGDFLSGQYLGLVPGLDGPTGSNTIYVFALPD